MGRRTLKAEIGFGSDSFLDIIANIVGILIILIVVAGVQASKAPILVVEEPIETEPKIEEPVPTPQEAPPAPLVVNELPPIHPALLLPPPPPPPPKKIEISNELLRNKRQIEAEIISLRQGQNNTLSRLNRLREKDRTLISNLNEKSSTLKEQDQEAQNRRRQIDQLVRAFKDSERMMNRLRQTVDLAEKKKPVSTQIKHRVTPLSRIVQGKEIHFRLSEGRVAHVPINELVERIRPQIERQKEWLIKYRSHQGEVGPVGGFLLQYLVERQALSVIEELQGGQGMVRIGVSQWKIISEPDLFTESTEEALLPTSNYVRVLRTADPDATLTFWVYPDSFDLHRQLRDFAYEEGFRVAARPLPFGVPIAGSPSGSRSAGQ